MQARVFDAPFHLLPSPSQCLPERNECNTAVQRLFVHSGGPDCPSSYLSDCCFHRIVRLSHVLFDLSLLPWSNSIPWNGIVTPDLFHDIDESYDPGSGHRAPHHHHVLSGLSSGLRSSSKDCAGYTPTLALRFNHGRDRLPYALSNLSLLSHEHSKFRECEGSRSY